MAGWQYQYQATKNERCLCWRPRTEDTARSYEAKEEEAPREQRSKLHPVQSAGNKNIKVDPPLMIDRAEEGRPKIIVVAHCEGNTIGEHDAHMNIVRGGNA